MPKLPISAWGFGCLAISGNSPMTLPGPDTNLPAAILSHLRCCGFDINRTREPLHKHPVWPLLRLFDWGENVTGRASALRRSVPEAKRMLSRECWPSNLPFFFKKGNCCNRVFLTVNIVVVGLAKAGTMSLMKILGAHPEIASLENVEDDALVSKTNIDLGEVMVYNFWVQQMLNNKVGARLIAVKHPLVIFNQEKMFRLSLIPNVKVVLMIREPTAWMVSFYNFYLQDCHRPGIAKLKFAGDPFKRPGLCCKKTEEIRGKLYCHTWPANERPRFWEDVVERRMGFSVADISVHHANFERQIIENFRVMFPWRSIAILDMGLLSEPTEKAVSEFQRLASFLGTSTPFKKQDLEQKLKEVQRTRGGHTQHRINFERFDICGNGTDAAFERANALFRSERESLNDMLSRWAIDSLNDSYISITQSLSQEPCPPRTNKAATNKRQ